MQPALGQLLATVSGPCGLDDFYVNAGFTNLSSLAEDLYNYLWESASTDKYHLYTNNITPTKSAGLTQFVEITTVEFPDYLAKAAVAGGTPGHDIDGNWQVDGVAPVIWMVLTTPPPSPINVYGIFVKDTTGAILRGWYRFPVPFVLAAFGDQISVLPSAKVIE